MAPFHDRMLAVLRIDEIPLFLAGEMRRFAPRPEDIKVGIASNPRGKKKDQKDDRETGGGQQLDLF